MASVIKYILLIYLNIYALSDAETHNNIFIIKYMLFVKVKPI